MIGNISKVLKLVVVVSGIQIGSVQNLAARDSQFTRITNINEVMTYVAGKSLNQNGTRVVFNADRTFHGAYRGRNMFGRWFWNSEENSFCIVQSEPRQEFNCRAMELQVGEKTIVRFRGRPTFRTFSIIPNQIPLFSKTLSE